MDGQNNQANDGQWSGYGAPVHRQGDRREPGQAGQDINHTPIDPILLADDARRAAQGMGNNYQPAAALPPFGRPDAQAGYQQYGHHAAINYGPPRSGTPMSSTASYDPRGDHQIPGQAQSQPARVARHAQPEAVNLPATLPGGPHPNLPGPAYGSMTQQYYMQVPIPAWQLIEGIGRLYPDESEGSWSVYPDPEVLARGPLGDANYGITPAEYLEAREYWDRWEAAGGQALIVPGVDGSANVPFRSQGGGAGSQAVQGAETDDPMPISNEELGWIPGEGCTYEDFVEHAPVDSIGPSVPWP